MACPELYWLPRAPEWNASLKGLDQGARDATPAGEAEWNTLVSLANARIESLGTLRLDRTLRKLFGGTAPAHLATKPVRLALLASSTVDHLLPGLRVGALRRGLWLDTYVCDYGQYSRELMDSGSDLHEYRPDTVLFALDANHLLAGFDPSDSADIVATKFERVADDVVRH